MTKVFEQKREIRNSDNSKLSAIIADTKKAMMQVRFIKKIGDPEKNSRIYRMLKKKVARCKTELNKRLHSAQ